MRLEHLENAPDAVQARAFFEWLRLFSRMAVGGAILPRHRSVLERKLA
jgi:hypothetical protein